MTKKRRLWRWIGRAAGVSLVAAGVVLWAARTGKFSERGYRVLYAAVAGPGRLAGAGDLSAGLFYAANCGERRNPGRWMDLVYERKSPGLAEAVFTCREPEIRFAGFLRK